MCKFISFALILAGLILGLSSLDKCLKATKETTNVNTVPSWYCRYSSCEIKSETLSSISSALNNHAKKIKEVSQKDSIILPQLLKTTSGIALFLLGIIFWLIDSSLSTSKQIEDLRKKIENQKIIENKSESISST